MSNHRWVLTSGAEADVAVAIRGLLLRLFRPRGNGETLDEHRGQKLRFQQSSHVGDIAHKGRSAFDNLHTSYAQAIPKES